MAGRSYVRNIKRKRAALLYRREKPEKESSFEDETHVYLGVSTIGESGVEN